jgi:hypothetical protein
VPGVGRGAGRAAGGAEVAQVRPAARGPAAVWCGGSSRHAEPSAAADRRGMSASRDHSSPSPAGC